jgi:hypothetical protein
LLKLLVHWRSLTGPYCVVTNVTPKSESVPSADHATASV